MMILITPIPPMQHLRKKLGLYFRLWLFDIRVISLSNVFEAESRDVTAKANMVKMYNEKNSRKDNKDNDNK